MKPTPLPKSKAKNAYDLLKDVRKVILEEPLRYDQTRSLVNKLYSPLQVRFPTCNTIGCRAGWVVVLKRSRPFTIFNCWAEARDILGLTYDQADNLFTMFAVPHEPQTKAHAQAGAKGITAFIRKYKKQLQAKKV